MKPLASILALLTLCASASAAVSSRISAALTLTNFPVTGNTVTINGSARTWTNSFSIDTISTNVTIAGSATNLYRHLTTNGPTGPILVTQTGATNITLLGSVGQAMSISSAGSWLTVSYSTQVVTLATAVRVPMDVEVASNRVIIASYLARDVAANSTSAFPSGSLLMSNYAGIRLGNTFYDSNHFRGSNLFLGSNTFLGPMLASVLKATNLTSAEGALTNTGVNVFGGTTRIGTMTATNGTIVSGTLSNATIYMDAANLFDIESWPAGAILSLQTNGRVTATNEITDAQIRLFQTYSGTIALSPSAAYPLHFSNAPFSGFRHDTFLSAETNAFALVSSNITLAVITPARIVLSNAHSGTKFTLTNSTTAISADPVNGSEMVATSGEWIYRSSATSEGAGQNNRVHNRAAEVVGSGTDYTLTASTAFVDFGGTDPDINTLPSAGTYLITALVTVTAGASANDVYNFKLRNATGAADISNSAQSVNHADASDKFQVVIQSIVTVTGADRIQLYGHNSTAARGTVNSTETKLTYVRLH